MNTTVSNRRHDLGAFVRACRERCSPLAAGFPPGLRRRTPGLRREEAAQLCGVSTTWYTWIEQGRDVSISPQALSRLAEAFRLSRAERAYLFEMSGKRDPLAGDGPEAESYPPHLQDVVAAVSSPAYLLDHAWDMAVWNLPAGRLFGGWLANGTDRNLLRYIFLDPAARSLIRGWEERARRVVAELRAETAARRDDPVLRELIDSLGQRSAEFARLWREQAVLGREGGERTFNHPREGFLRYMQSTFVLAGHPGLKLVILIKQEGASSPDRAAIPQERT